MSPLWIKSAGDCGDYESPTPRNFTNGGGIYAPFANFGNIDLVVDIPLPKINAYPSISLTADSLLYNKKENGDYLHIILVYSELSFNFLYEYSWKYFDSDRTVDAGAWIYTEGTIQGWYIRV